MRRIGAWAPVAGGVGRPDLPTKAATRGAYTGDISAAMLAEAGATHVILGHSERRADHGETNEVVHAQAEAALAAGLKIIVCVGETEAERDADVTLEVVGSQLAGSVPEGCDGRKPDHRL